MVESRRILSLRDAGSRECSLLVYHCQRWPGLMLRIFILLTTAFPVSTPFGVNQSLPHNRKGEIESCTLPTNPFFCQASPSIFACDSIVVHFSSTHSTNPSSSIPARPLPSLAIEREDTTSNSLPRIPPPVPSLHPSSTFKVQEFSSLFYWGLTRYDTPPELGASRVYRFQKYGHRFFVFLCPSLPGIVFELNSDRRSLSRFLLPLYRGHRVPKMS